MGKFLRRMPNTCVLIALIVIMLFCPMYLVSVLAENDSTSKIELTATYEQGTPKTYENTDYYPAGTKFQISGTNMSSDDDSITTTYTVQVTTDGENYKDAGALTADGETTIDSADYSGLTNMRIMITSTIKAADTSEEESNTTEDSNTSEEGSDTSDENVDVSDEVTSKTETSFIYYDDFKKDLEGGSIVIDDGRFPEISIEYTSNKYGSYNEITYYPEDTTCTIKITDTTLANATITVDDNAKEIKNNTIGKTITETITLTSTSQSISIEATDAVENKSTKDIGTIAVDDSSIELSVVDADNKSIEAEAYVSSNVKATLTITSNSGVSTDNKSLSIEPSKSGSWSQSDSIYTYKVSLDKDGSYTINAFTIKTNGGKELTCYGITFTIDTTKPEIALTIKTDDYKGTYSDSDSDNTEDVYTSMPTVTLSIDEENIDTTTATVDGIKQTLTLDENKANITGFNEDSRIHTISITTTDKAGNKVTYSYGSTTGGSTKINEDSSTSSGGFIIDDEAPTIVAKANIALAKDVPGSSSVADNDGIYYFKADTVTFTVTITDAALKTVKINDDVVEAEQDSDDPTVWSTDITYKAGNEPKTLMISATDVGGHKTTAENNTKGSNKQIIDSNGIDLACKEFVIDNTNPNIESINVLGANYQRTNGNYDYYKSNSAAVVVTVSDENFKNTLVPSKMISASGSTNISKSWERSEDSDATWTATITYENAGTYTISVTAYDWAAGSTNIDYGMKGVSQQEGESIGSGASYIVLDGTAPKITSIVFDKTATNTSANTNIDYFNQTTTVTITLKDSNLNVGDKGTKLSVTGGSVTQKWTEGNDGVWTSKLKFTEGTNLTYQVKVVDWANNSTSFSYGDKAADSVCATKDASGVILTGDSATIDTIAPVVKYTLDQTRVGDEFNGADYFADTIVLTVSVTDVNFNPDTTTLKKDGTELIGLIWDDESATTWITTIDYEQGIGHTLDITTKDWAKNRASYRYGDSQEKLRTYKGTSKKATTTKDASKTILTGNSFVIDITAPKVDSVTTNTNLVNSLDKKSDTDGGYQFYNSDTKMTIHVTEKIGLDSVVLGNTGNYYYIANDVTKGDTSKKIVVALADGKEFTDSVILQATDIAQNTRTWSIAPSGKVKDITGSNEANTSLNGLGVYPEAVIQDTVKPALKLSGVTEGAKYNIDQNVTLDINELNFRYLKSYETSQVVMTIHKVAGDASLKETDQTIPVSALSAVNNGYDGLYSYTQALSEDGDYTIDAQVTDPATNVGEASIGKFTIDKTNPTIDVTFDNNDVYNGSYYKAARVAKIVIEEHNFDPSLISITTEGTLGSWTTSGDTHTITVSYTVDGDYTLSVSGQDLIGNTFPTYTAEAFTVDLTAPTITFFNVEDTTAYGGEIAPQIVFEDEKNFDAGACAYTLTAVNVRAGVIASFDIGVLKRDRSEIVSYDDFPHEIEVDDIYSLEAKITDLAGNEAVGQVIFSVNRFGSNYIVQDADKYTTSTNRGVFAGGKDGNTPTIYVTEINVSGIASELEGNEDLLETEAIISRNLKTMNLMLTDDKVNTGYSVKQSTERNTGWAQYDYTVKNGNFYDEGNYEIVIRSSDTAGNNNQSSEFYEHDGDDVGKIKSAMVDFVVDTTDPIIQGLDIEDGAVCEQDKRTVTFSVVDNVGFDVEDVVATLEGKNGSTEVELSHSAYGTYSFEVTKSSFDPRTLTVKVTDWAGLSSEVKVKDFRVTTNIFELHLPEVIVSTLVVVALIGGGIYYYIHKRAQKDTKEQKQNIEKSEAA